ITDKLKDNLYTIESSLNSLKETDSVTMLVPKSGTNTEKGSYPLLGEHLRRYLSRYRGTTNWVLNSIEYLTETEIKSFKTEDDDQKEGGKLLLLEKFSNRFVLLHQ